jgi:hypothetical protein
MTAEDSGKGSAFGAEPAFTGSVCGEAWNFEPVRTKADLLSLDADEITRGYMDAERGDPQPGVNRGRAYWHGWRNRMMDLREIPLDDASAQLAHAIAPNGKFDPEVFGELLALRRRRAKL